MPTFQCLIRKLIYNDVAKFPVAFSEKRFLPKNLKFLRIFRPLQILQQLCGYIFAGLLCCDLQLVQRVNFADSVLQAVVFCPLCAERTVL